MKLQWLILSGTMLLLSAAGCRSTPEVGDVQLAGVYTRGVTYYHADRKVGYCRPYIELNPRTRRITVEESDHAIWSSAYRRDGDRLTIANPAPDFPAELEIGREKAPGLKPVLTARSGTFFHPVAVTYGKQPNFPRKVGEPIPAVTEVQLENREVELTPAAQQLIARVEKIVFPGFSCRFSRIEERTADGKLKIELNMPGRIIVQENDPARPGRFLVGLGSGGSLEIKSGDSIIRIYSRK